jgi:hypothetical protein
MKRTGFCLLLAVCVLSCDKKIKVPELPNVQLEGLLPKSSNGNFTLFEVSQAKLNLNPLAKDPLTGLGACSDLITYCFEPGKSSLDDCVHSVPLCQTRTPWEESRPCCPEVCVRAYESNRKRAEPFVAFESAFFGARSCYPGVSEFVGGAP